jgi:hypothetical protein
MRFTKYKKVILLLLGILVIIGGFMFTHDFFTNKEKKLLADNKELMKELSELQTQEKNISIDKTKMKIILLSKIATKKEFSDIIYFFINKNPKIQLQSIQYVPASLKHSNYIANNVLKATGGSYKNILTLWEVKINLVTSFNDLFSLILYLSKDKYIAFSQSLKFSISRNPKSEYIYPLARVELYLIVPLIKDMLR